MASNQKKQHEKAGGAAAGGCGYSECLKNFLSACARNISASTKAALLAPPSSYADDLGSDSLPRSTREDGLERNADEEPPGQRENPGATTTSDNNSYLNPSRSDSSPPNAGMAATVEQPHQHSISGNPIPWWIHSGNRTAPSKNSDCPDAGTSVATAVDYCTSTDNNRGSAPAEGATNNDVSKEPLNEVSKEPLERGRDGTNEGGRDVSGTPWWVYNGKQGSPPKDNTLPTPSKNPAITPNNNPKNTAWGEIEERQPLLTLQEEREQPALLEKREGVNGSGSGEPRAAVGADDAIAGDAAKWKVLELQDRQTKCARGSWFPPVLELSSVPEGGAVPSTLDNAGKSDRQDACPSAGKRGKSTAAAGRQSVDGLQQQQQQEKTTRPSTRAQAQQQPTAVPPASTVMPKTTTTTMIPTSKAPNNASAVSPKPKPIGEVKFAVADSSGPRVVEVIPTESVRASIKRSWERSSSAQAVSPVFQDCLDHHDDTVAPSSELTTYAYLRSFAWMGAERATTLAYSRPSMRPEGGGGVVAGGGERERYLSAQKAGGSLRQDDLEREGSAAGAFASATRFTEGLAATDRGKHEGRQQDSPMTQTWWSQKPRKDAFSAAAAAATADSTAATAARPAAAATPVFFGGAGASAYKVNHFTFGRRVTKETSPPYVEECEANKPQFSRPAESVDQSKGAIEHARQVRALEDSQAAGTATAIKASIALTRAGRRAKEKERHKENAKAAKALRLQLHKKRVDPGGLIGHLMANEREDGGGGGGGAGGVAGPAAGNSTAVTSASANPPAGGGATLESKTMTTNTTTKTTATVTNTADKPDAAGVSAAAGAYPATTARKPLPGGVRDTTQAPACPLPRPGPAALKAVMSPGRRYAENPARPFPAASTKWPPPVPGAIGKTPAENAGFQMPGSVAAAGTRQAPLTSNQPTYITFGDNVRYPCTSKQEQQPGQIPITFGTHPFFSTPASAVVVAPDLEWSWPREQVQNSSGGGFGSKISEAGAKTGFGFFFRPPAKPRTIVRVEWIARPMRSSPGKLSKRDWRNRRRPQIWEKMVARATIRYLAKDYQVEERPNRGA